MVQCKLCTSETTDADIFLDVAKVLLLVDTDV